MEIDWLAARCWSTAVLSLTGFLAVSFTQRSLCIVDLRGPEILLREGFDEDGEDDRSGEGSVASKLRWSVCGYGNGQSILFPPFLGLCLHDVRDELTPVSLAPLADVTPAVRLFISYAKGLTKVYSLVHHDLAGWQLDRKKTHTFSHDSLVYPLASYILDVSTGDELELDPSRLQSSSLTSFFTFTACWHALSMRLAAVMNPAEAQKEASRLQIPGTTSAKPHCVWLACGRRSIRTQVNVTGERIGKVEMDEDIKHAFLVKRQSAKIFIIFTESGTAKVFALPSLQLILRLPLQ
jgi:syntaxin-binding protein 5